MSPQEALEKEIAEKQEKLKQMKDANKTSARSKAVKELSEFTDEEKIKGFEAIHAAGMSVLKDAEEKGYTSESESQWAFEGQMGAIARDNKLFWAYYNSLT